MILTILSYLIAAFMIPRIMILCSGKTWRWRRVMFLVAMIVIVLAAFLPNYGMTVQLAAMLFIPCGVKFINRPRYYWLRQVLFACGAISGLLS